MSYVIIVAKGVYQLARKKSWLMIMSQKLKWSTSIVATGCMITIVFLQAKKNRRVQENTRIGWKIS